MKKYSVLIIGIILLILSVVWMMFIKASTGPFLSLGALSGAVIGDGIYRLRKK